VHAGAGLLYASMDQSESLSETLGVELKGKNKVWSMQLSQSLVSESNTLSFIRRTELRTVKLKGATALASIVIASDEKDDHHSNKLRMLNTASSYVYGEGQSMYIGLNVLSEITSGLHNGVLASLLDKSLDVLHDHTKVVAGGLVPITLDVRNLACVTTMGQVSLSLPAGIRVFDSGNAVTQADGSLLWFFDLSLNAQSSWTFWLQLPTTSGGQAIHALLQANITQLPVSWSADVPLMLNIATKPLIKKDNNDGESE